MKTNLKLAGGVLLLLAGMLCSLSAQEANIRFRTLAWQGEIEGIFYVYKGKAREIKATDNIRSPFYRAAAAPELVFYRQVVDPEGKPQLEILGRVATAKTGSTLLLLIAKKPDGSYFFSAAADDLGSFPPGSYRFVNASLTPLSLSAESAKANLASGQTTTLRPDIDRQTRGVLIRVATQSSPRQLLYSNRLAAYADQRTLIYAMDSGNSRNPVMIKRIMENTRIAADPGNETPKAQ